jgi:hypothetical protein
MSAAHTTAATTTPRVRFRRATRSTLARKIAAGVLAAALVALLAVALWPASEADKARSDGEQLGRAVVELRDAQSPADVDAALADVHRAAQDTREHAGDAVGDQVDEQADALDRAVDGFVGSHTSDDSFEADLYQAELDTAVDDLTSQAGDFRSQGPEVQQAFWDGYETAVDAA